MTARKANRRRNKIRDALLSDEAMVRLLDHLFGRENYAYDPECDVWITLDQDHIGPGRGFIVVQRGGDWRRIVLSGWALQ